MAFAYRIANVSSCVPMRHASNARDLATEIDGTETACWAGTCQEASRTCGNHPNSPTLARSRSRGGGVDPSSRCFHGFRGGQPRGIRLRGGTSGADPGSGSGPSGSIWAPERAVPRDWSGVIAALKWVGVILFSATTAAGGLGYQRRITVSATGSVTIQTTPPGREVLVDGRSLGLSPVRVALAPAAYAFQVGSGTERRDLAVDVSAGSFVLQHLELAAAPATPVATTGALHVQTEPSGQTITVDGVERGQSPITVNDLSEGDHTIVARGTAGTVRRSVAVRPERRFRWCFRQRLR